MLLFLEKKAEKDYVKKKKKKFRVNVAVDKCGTSATYCCKHKLLTCSEYYSEFF